MSTQPTTRNTNFKPLYGLKWFPTLIWNQKLIKGLAISIPDPPWSDPLLFLKQHLNILWHQTSSNNTSTTYFWKVSTQPAKRNTNFKPLYGLKRFPTSIWNQKLKAWPSSFQTSLIKPHDEALAEAVFVKLICFVFSLFPSSLWNLRCQSAHQIFHY